MIEGIDTPYEDGPPWEPWLCQCGNGSLGGTQMPEVCPLCEFPLREHFLSMLEEKALLLRGED